MEFIAFLEGQDAMRRQFEMPASAPAAASRTGASGRPRIGVVKASLATLLREAAERLEPSPRQVFAHELEARR